MASYKRSAIFSAIRGVLGMPDAAITKLAGEPIEVDGRVLNRSIQLLLAGEQRMGDGALDAGTVQERRKMMRQSAKIGMPLAKGLHISDRLIQGGDGLIPARVYRPFNLEPTPPAIVYYHGGGWVIGDIDTHDGSCRTLAVESGCVVISVDYRLAPEHPWPAPLEDCMAAYSWVVSHAADLSINPAAVAVAGDSAGGNLAAVVAQETRKLDVRQPVAQGLIYPATDFRLKTKSVELFAEGFFLTRESMDWFRNQYIPAGQDITDPTISPLLSDDLSGVGPAWIWTAGFDPLRDEGRNYAEALEKAGVQANYRCYDDMVHGFFGMGVVPGGLEIIEEMSRQFGELIRSQIQ